MARPAGWLLAVVATYAIQVSNLWYQVGNDASGHLSIAKNLWTRGVYERAGQPNLHYAPGYPTVIAPAWALGDYVFLGVALLNLLFIIGVSVLTYIWLRRYVAKPVATVVTLFALINANVWAIYREPLSEILFLLLLLGSGLCFNMVVDRMRQIRLGVDIADGKPAGWSMAGWLLVACLVMALSTTVRQTGTLIVPGFTVVTLWALWRGKVGWIATALSNALAWAVAVATALTLIIFESNRNAAARAAGMDVDLTYAEIAMDMSVFEALVMGVERNLNAVGRLMLPGTFGMYAEPGQWLNPVLWLYLVLCGLLVWGWWRVARRFGDVLMWMLPFYVGLYVLWPFGQGARFYVPLMPMLAWCVYALVRDLPRHRMSVMTILVVLHLVAAAGLWARHAGDAMAWSRHWEPMRQVAGVLPDVAGDGVLVELSPAERVMLTVHSNRMWYWQAEKVGEATLVLIEETKAMPAGYVEASRAAHYKIGIKKP